MKSPHEKALKAIHTKKDSCHYCGGGHESKKHYLTTSPYNRGENKSGLRKGKGGTKEY